MNCDDKIARLDRANKMIEAIASCGRKFFRDGETVATLELDNRGRVWFHDSYSKQRIFTHRPGQWRGFSSGGTLRRLVENLRDYVTRGDLLQHGVFGPWPQWLASGDLWGYGSEMEKVRQAAEALGIMGDAVKEVA